MGHKVWSGSCLVMVGSMTNALTYVLTESIMTKNKEALSVQVNCAIQGSVGCVVLCFWQLIYTRPRYDNLIRQPMERANTTLFQAACILVSFAIANFIHYMSFFYTLKHFWGGRGDKCWCHEGITSSIGICRYFPGILRTNWRHGNVLFSYQVYISGDCCGRSVVVWKGHCKSGHCQGENGRNLLEGVTSPIKECGVCMMIAFEAVLRVTST